MLNHLRIVALGDIHFGAPRTENLEHELNEVFFPWLEANQFDAVLQLGDLFDRRLPLDSNESKTVFRFVVRLCQLCQRREIPLRILRGTLSHEGFQAEVLRPLETEFPTFRLILTAAHEELVPGFDVLWMPEEYPENYDNFYGHFFSDEGGELVYDGIFGHGEIDVAAGWSAVSEGERPYGGTPTHSAERLLAHSSGLVWFGHIHNRFRYRGRLGYPGSFGRWCHGEEAAKGFDILNLTAMEGGGWEVRTTVIENTLAPLYRTLAADELLDAADPPDEIVRKIREAARSCQHLRVRFGGFPLGVEEYSLVRGSLVEDRGVELQSAAAAPLAEGTGPTDATTEPGEGEAVERLARLSYLRDPGIPLEGRLLRYMGERYPDRAAGITVDDIRELTAPLV
jgi:hypothetical protein